jgi:predicted phosphodiesterase
LERLALFSDVHGNLPALDAVLGDIESSGIARAYCLGDLVGYGPDPSGVVRRMRALAVPTVRGNYDDGVGHRRGQCGCFYATDQARRDGAESYAFTDAALDEDDHEWLAALPDSIRLNAEGLALLLAHGSPRKINEYLLPDRTDEQLIRLAEQAGADVVCVGHVHVPYHRAMTAPDGLRVHYVSSGSVGKPKDGDPRAAWVEVVIGTEQSVLTAAAGDPAATSAGRDAVTWVGVLVHRVPYDVEAVAAATLAAGLPGRLAEALRLG